MTPCGDDRALAAAIGRLLDDPRLHARLRAAGLRRVQAYAWPDVAASVLELYARVLHIGAAA
jgi:glycosyltransferase involved in cell wall biosynthesis